MINSHFHGMKLLGDKIKFANNLKRNTAIKELQAVGMNGLDGQADNLKVVILFADEETATQAFDLLDAIENLEVV